MDTLLYILIIGCLALVLGWYLINETAGADGELGPLAVDVEPDKDTAENNDPAAAQDATGDPTARRYAAAARGQRFAIREYARETTADAAPGASQDGRPSQPEEEAQPARTLSARTLKDRAEKRGRYRRRSGSDSRNGSR